jgi:hypothetical protein
MSEFVQLESNGFVRVEGRPELSYSNPRFEMSRLGLNVGRPESHRQGTYMGGAAVRIGAVSNAWLRSSLRDGRHRLTCQGTGVAEVLCPEVEKDGISTHAIEYLNLIVTTRGTSKLELDMLIGDVTFSYPVPGLTGRRLQAELELETSLLRNALMFI